VSDEDNSFARRPTIGSRRVSMLVGVPVVVGCAVLGSVIGVTYPLQSMFPVARQSGELSDLSLSSAKLVETPSEAAQPPSAPSSVLDVRTGSVDRPLSSGGGADVAATQGDPPDLAPPQGAPRARGQNQSHSQARARRLRRTLARPASPKSAGAQVDAFITSILPSK
jgi:hypothetical protein